MRLRFQKGDMAAVAGVLLLAALILVLFLPKEAASAVYAEVYQDGQLIKTVSLAVDQEFTVTGPCTNTVAVRDGKIAVIRSDCPGEDCISCGWLGEGGRSIVCLPNGLEIRVVADENGVDFVVG